MRRGVSTASVVKVSSPRRLTDCTSLSCWTVPFFFTFLALETKDILGTLEKQTGMINGRGHVTSMRKKKGNFVRLTVIKI